eukprot:m.193290 g.193290  ORF g.193290 m.193290 type:complete len:309 (-) comp18889_c0_seq1:89-1015(-)
MDIIEFDFCAGWCLYYAIGAVVLLIAVVTAIVCCCCCRSRRSRDTTKMDSPIRLEDVEKRPQIQVRRLEEGPVGGQRGGQAQSLHGRPPVTASHSAIDIPSEDGTPVVVSVAGGAGVARTQSGAKTIQTFTLPISSVDSGFGFTVVGPESHADIQTVGNGIFVASVQGPAVPGLQPGLQIMTLNRRPVAGLALDALHGILATCTSSLRVTGVMNEEAFAERCHLTPFKPTGRGLFPLPRRSHDFGSVDPAKTPTCVETSTAMMYTTPSPSRPVETESSHASVDNKPCMYIDLMTPALGGARRQLAFSG